ncbi:MAG: hypothetical protein Q9226_005187 [Calogaya cf. arnoldii]
MSSTNGYQTAPIPPGIFPPPLGVTPDYVDPEWNDCGIIPLMCIFIPLSTIFLVLRIYTKARIIKVVGWEDVAMIVAWLCTAANEACFIYSMEQRTLGIHTWNMRIDQLVPNAKVRSLEDSHFPDREATPLTNTSQATAAAVTFYIPAVGLPKISILIFYLRLNPSKGFRYSTFAVMAITFAFMISAILAQLLQCHPVPKVWNPTLPGTCVDTNPLYLSNSIINTIIDFLVLLLPIPMIVRLQVNTRTKLVLAAIFSLCSGTVIVSALRIWAITLYQKVAADVIWESMPVNSVSVVEMNLMVVCGSIMVLRPFCRRHFPFLLGSGKSRPTDESPANQGMHYDGPMGPRSKSGYRAKVSGGSGGVSGKRSIWSGLGTTRTAGNDDDDMESLSTELGMLAPPAMHAREKNVSSHTRNKSRGPRARDGGSEGMKEPWQDYEHLRDSATARDGYARDVRDHLENGIVKTVSLDIR